MGPLIVYKSLIKDIICSVLRSQKSDDLPLTWSINAHCDWSSRIFENAGFSPSLYKQPLSHHFPWDYSFAVLAGVRAPRIPAATKFQVYGS
jgi:hypothetical protein